MQQVWRELINIKGLMDDFINDFFVMSVAG